MEEVSTDVSKESKIDNTASEVKSEESQNADDDTEAHVKSSETNAVESS